jgi:hypothetical protein
MCITPVRRTFDLDGTSFWVKSFAPEHASIAEKPLPARPKQTQLDQLYSDHGYVQYSVQLARSADLKMQLMRSPVKMFATLFVAAKY